MSERVKNYLGWAIILAVLAVAYSAVSYVGSFAKTIRPDSFRSFTVTAVGKAVAIPDVAEFTFTVLNQGGKDIAALRADNEKKVNQAIEFLKETGVAKADIKTESYSLEPRYENYSCGGPYSAYPVRVGGGGASEACPPPSIVGYSVSQMVSVKVRKDNFERVGEVLAGVVTAGANQVSQLQFTVDDKTKVENEARAEAIALAQDKAEAIARAAGFGIGRLLSIDDGFAMPYYDARAEVAKFSLGGVAADAAPAPMVEPGSQELSVNVTLRYEIE